MCSIVIASNENTPRLAQASLHEEFVWGGGCRGFEGAFCMGFLYGWLYDCIVWGLCTGGRHYEIYIKQKHT